jgi:transposase
MDKTAIARLCRVSWRTVGRVCERVAASELDPGRLDGLFRIGVDEISWRKHHKYLTLVVDNDGGKVVWGAAGHNAKTLDQFFNELGPERAALIEAVSMDLGGAYLKSVTGNLGDDVLICADIFHLVALATTALDQVRRPLWQELRHVDADLAKKFKGARWALVKNPKTSPTAKP